MDRKRRWDPCISHRGSNLYRFIAEYFGQGNRRIFLVAGAGFDPRASSVALELNRTGVCMRALLVKENRPEPARQQSDRADANTRTLLSVLADVQLEPIEIFGSDGAVVGGRSIISVLSQEHFESVTDIIVDVSALSVGICFPIIRYFVEHRGQRQEGTNLHVFVAHNPHTDANIHPIPSDTPGYVHGFRGGSTLSANVDAARLWLPQLARGRRGALERLYDFVAPDDICPILPFPSNDPRLGDVLADEYLTELQSTWEVDSRNIVYADEGDPLDLYRTILKLDDLRQPVFKETGGSMLLLSPLGNRVMALGALMAALERNLPVAYVEALDYEMTPSEPVETEGTDLIHLWLDGDVYPDTRPPLLTDGAATT